MISNDRLINCSKNNPQMNTTTLDRKALDALSSGILKSAIAVHREMGPGLLGSVYHQCMIKELKDRQLKVDKMVPIRLHYKGLPLSKDYVIDILVEDEIRGSRRMK